MDDLFAGIQPGNDGGAGTPPAPEPPTPPAADPAASEAPPATDANTDANASANAEPTPEEKAEADEWAKATKDIFPGLESLNKKEDDKNEPPKPKENSEEVDPNKEVDTSKKPGEESSEPGADDKKKNDDGTGESAEEDEPAGPPELSASDRQQLEVAVKSEVTQRMFTEEVNGKPVITTPDGSKYFLDANGKPMLADKDGDPIRDMNDLMQRVNPNTGKPFTEEQAGMYLLTAQQRMRDNVAAMQNRVDEIASTGLTMREESEVVAWEYGELLKAMPELQKDLWDEYKRTLVTDPKTGIVTKAPSSLKKFYEIALEPYAELGRRLEAQGAQTPAPGTSTTPPATNPKKDQQAAQEKRQQARQDRSDIYGGGKVDDATDDDKEWGAAAQAVFGDQLKDLRR